MDMVLTIASTRANVGRFGCSDLIGILLLMSVPGEQATQY
jgi:hypothetical protein